MLKELLNRKNNSSIHIVFLLILSLNYLIPFLIFGNITLFYNDVLDSEVVYNYIIGKHYSGSDEALNLFINGEINLNFLRRIFQPLIIFYYLFDLEFAYWLTDVFVKLVSYFTFYSFSKKINDNLFFCGLTACLFASINIPTHNGLGIAIFPYIIFLCISEEKISIKHLIILIFFGLNSDLIFTVFALPFLFISLIILSKKGFKFYDLKSIKIFIIFSISMLISNFNLIFLSFSDVTLHREEFFKEPDINANLLIYFLVNLLRFINEINFSFFFNLPYFLITFFLLLSVFFSNQKKAIYIFFLVIAIQAILTFLGSEIYLNFYNGASGLARTLNFGYCSTILPFLYCLVIIHLLKDNKIFFKNFFQVIVFVTIILSQTNSSIVPFYKKFISKEANYRNIYTFNGYYLFDDYKKLKNIVKNERTISVGIDPMIAIANDIATIDGYHNIYPLSYKKKFRAVIENEIEKNNDFKKYYDNWGSRIYAFVIDPSNVSINFIEAKNLGAKYVISKYDLSSNRLKLVCDDCSNFVKLYSIK